MMMVMMVVRRMNVMIVGRMVMVMGMVRLWSQSRLKIDVEDMTEDII